MLGIAEGVTSADDLNSLFFHCFREVLGKQGTILVPTYSYTFGASTKSQPALFDPSHTPSRIGPFPEFFRRQPGVLRSEDPMMSIAGLGPACEALFRDLAPTSYGADSVFARLCELPAKCCNVGLGPNWTPFIHHADWLARVPFRYDKLFTGDIVRNGRRERLDWLYSVRILSDEGRADAHRLGKMAVEAGLWNWAALGRGRIYAAGYRAYFDFAMEMLRRDAWLQAAGPPGDPEDLEDRRVGRQSFLVAWSPLASWPEQLRAFRAVPRHTVSDGYDAALQAIAAALPVSVTSFATGSACYDWVTPEKWRCMHASVTNVKGDVLLSAAAGSGDIMPYSVSFEGEVDAAELASHLYIRTGLPRSSDTFMQRDWGFLCTKAEAARVAKGAYRVSIETAFSYGRMKVGELNIPGSSQSSVLVCVHLGQSAADEETLSGVVVTLDWFRRRRAAGGASEVGYRLLILPGSVGLAAWLADHEAELNDIIAALTVRRLAGDDAHVVQLSLSEDTLLDRRTRQVKEGGSRIRLVAAGEIWDEFPSGGNPVHRDRSRWGKLPMLTLSRLDPEAGDGRSIPVEDDDQLQRNLAESSALLDRLLS